MVVIPVPMVNSVNLGSHIILDLLLIILSLEGILRSVMLNCICKSDIIVFCPKLLILLHLDRRGPGWIIVKGLRKFPELLRALVTTELW
jgi:hypothetical protein